MTLPKPNHHLYRAYGINIASEIACPELLEGGSPVEAEIRTDLVPETLDGNFITGHKFYAKPNQLLIHTNTIAKLLVSDGNRILVEHRPGARDYEVRLLLLGWGLGGLLQQRDLLPLHGAAVKIGQESFVICADPKVGKSTLTAAFVQHGYQFLDDNIVAVQNVDGHPIVVPGYPNIKLWEDSLEQLDIKPAVLQPVRPNIPKYALDFRDMFYDTPLPIGAVYILSRRKGSQLSINSLNGSEKFSALSSQVFCRRFIFGLGKQEFLFNSLINLSQGVEVVQVLIPEERPSPNKMVENLIDNYLSKTNRR